MMTSRKATALRYGIAAPFDSHVNDVDRLEAPQVVGRARWPDIGNAIADSDGGEPDQQNGDRKGERQRKPHTGSHKDPPPGRRLTEHPLIERVRSIRDLPFIEQAFQSGI